jgi:hypothetical protein
MAMRTFTRKDVEDLVNRLLFRGTSRALAAHPSLQEDFRAASAVLRFALDRGFPPISIDVDIPDADTTEGADAKRFCEMTDK